jgi:Ran GTPase-activating protein (RanGAP) involved in mRNA processing and transport
MLLNVLHLNLPDNLLRCHDIKLIANMLKKNPPLRILNLSYNNFDYECAEVLGDSLIDNTRLKSLDLAFNRLGDIGIRNLLYPMIKLSLKQEGSLAGNQLMRY